jgi:Leucine-rich repeat (LRR) protein
LLIGQGVSGTGLEQTTNQIVTTKAKKMLNCNVGSGSSKFWPEHKYCKVTKVDLSHESQFFFNVTQDERIEEISVVQFWFGRDVVHIPLEIFQQFPKLNGLRINRYKIGVLKDDLFPVALKRLKYLDLSENKIQILGFNVFQSLTKLKWLNLNFNGIRALSHGLFFNNVKLTYIYLYGNSIVGIDSGIVSDSSPLKYVDLRENSEDVNEEYTCFSTKCHIEFPEIHAIYAILESVKPFITGEKITIELKCRYRYRYSWMELHFRPENKYCQVVKAQVDKEGTKIFEFTGTDRERQETTAVQFLNALVINYIPVEIFESFPSLKGFSIELSSIPTLKNNLFTRKCEKIEFLSLAYNEIEVIEPLAFKNLTRLLWINFEGNSIKSLEYQVFAYNKKLTYISFELSNIEMINRKLFRNLENLQEVNFEKNECIDDQIECHTENCNLEIYIKLLPFFESCNASHKYNKPNELRVMSSGFSSSINQVQTLNCTFKILSEPHAGKFCEIEDADFSAGTRDAEFIFQVTEVEKNETTGVLFSLCYDIEFVPTQIFKKFPSADTLGIKRSYIPVLKNNLFTSEFDKIKYLMLPLNEIKTIEPEAFQHLTKLKFIDLSFNKIEALKSNIFKKNLRLESILLNNNQIKMLNTNLFHNLAKLVNLNFKRNECADRVNAYEFKNLRRELSICYKNCESDDECKSNAAEELEAEKEIRSITCSYNQIKWRYKTVCFVANTELRSDIIYEISNAEGVVVQIGASNQPKTYKVEAVYFKSSPVVEIVPFELIEVFPKLNSVAFYQSKIPILRANFFTKIFSKIKEVLLKENGIQQIEDEAFHELEDLEEIDLSLNEIKSINEELFSHNPNLKVINLSGNQIFMIQRDSFEQQLSLMELNLLSNECISTKFGCDLFHCPEINETNDYLENCYSNYLEQEQKLKECKLSSIDKIVKLKYFHRKPLWVI